MCSRVSVEALKRVDASVVYLHWLTRKLHEEGRLCCTNGIFIFYHHGNAGCEFHCPRCLF